MDPLTYRPISLLTMISKVMESIIIVEMKSFLFSNNLISDHRFGFIIDHGYLRLQVAVFPTLLSLLFSCSFIPLLFVPNRCPTVIFISSVIFLLHEALSWE